MKYNNISSSWQYLITIFVAVFLAGCLAPYSGLYSAESRSATRHISNIVTMLDRPPTPKEREELSNFIAILEKRFYRRVNTQSLYDPASSGMIKAKEDDANLETPELLKIARNSILHELDKYSEYFDPQEYRQFQQSISGRFSGIGVRIYANKEGAKLDPLPNSPAKREGLASGDIITHVGAQEIAGKSIGEIAELLRGRAGSNVGLSITRYQSTGKIKRFRVTIRRENIRQSAVSAKIVDAVAHIQISTFQNDTSDELVKTIRKLEQKQGIIGYILDLRHNPGGYLNQAIAVADLFVERGILVSVVSRDDKDVYTAKKNNEETNKPIVVLVDKATASSSEIVAEAIQVNRRGVVIGIETFGKGTVQSLISLSDGSGLKLTTARYQSPNGRFMVEHGVDPNIIVVDDPNTKIDEALKRAKEYLFHHQNQASSH